MPIDSDSTRETPSISFLEELEMNSEVEIRGIRENASVRVKAAVTVRPANLAERDTRAIDGVTGDLQRSGVTCMLTLPVLVGDLFHLSFDRESLDMAPSIVVCDRSAMLGDDAFETHFRFLQDVDLPVHFDSGS